LPVSKNFSIISSPAAEPNHQRGDQGTAGKYWDSNADDRDANLITTVINNSLAYGATNDGSFVDVIWTSQTSNPSIPYEKMEKPNAPFVKLYVPVDWSNQESLSAKLFQFGTIITDDNGNIITFYGNKDAGAARQKEDGSFYIDIEGDVYQELRSAGNKAGYDYGSFSMNNAMTLALWDFWMNKRNDAGELMGK